MLLKSSKKSRKSNQGCPRDVKIGPRGTPEPSLKTKVEHQFCLVMPLFVFRMGYLPLSKILVYTTQFLAKAYRCEPMLAYACLCLHMLSYACLCSPMLTYACLCLSMLAYAYLCSPMLAYAYLCFPMLAYACLCLPMLTYVCLYSPMLTYACP